MKSLMFSLLGVGVLSLSACQTGGTTGTADMRTLSPGGLQSRVDVQVSTAQNTAPSANKTPDMARDTRFIAPNATDR